MQHILCPQDMIILMIEHIRNTDQERKADFNMSDVNRQEIRTGNKGFQQAINETSGPSFCDVNSTPDKE